MEEGQNESMLTGYPKVIPYENHKKIIEQMENNICRIKIRNEKGTGFFCKIPFPNKNNMLPVFITNNHVIDEDILYKNEEKIIIDIKGKKEMETKTINLNKRKKYTNVEYDTTIFEIKKSDEINNFLELDENIINDIVNNNNINNEYIDETIYIIQYPEGELSVSYGVLDKIYEDKKYNFQHKCSTKPGSSGSPILNIKNNKIIGIHKKAGNKTANNIYNIGAFLNYAIKEFIKQNMIKKDDDIIFNDILINEFNQKYKLNIKENDVKLDLSRKNLGNDGLKNLGKINFKELKELDLYGNNISDIKILNNFKLNKLEILDLGNNKIKDINNLDEINFEELKELYLNENNISEIKVFKNVKFEKLKILDLSDNNLSDINIFEKTNFPELEKLYLNNNSVTDIKIFEKINFNKLKMLYLYDNKIDKENNNLIISYLNSKILDFLI